MDENTERERRGRGLVVLLLLLGVGALLVTGIVVTRDGGKARKAADVPQGGGVTASPTPSSSGLPTVAPSASPTLVPTVSPTPGTGSNGDGSGTIGGGDGGGSTDGPLSGVFFLSGGTTGLRPGLPAVMTVSVRNPNPWPFQLLTLDTSVGAANAGCPSSSLSVGRYAFSAGDVKILAPAGATITVTVPVELLDSTTVDQNACAGATFPLTFRGTGVRAGA